MKITQIRNATIRVQYGGKTFLVDPWLADKGAMGTFQEVLPGAVTDPIKAATPMPMCSLPMSVDDILSGVDAYIITHIHPDHIDMDMASGMVGQGLDKGILTYVQNEDDAALLKKSGFQHIEILTVTGCLLGDVRLIKTPACHGTIVPCGPACGILFQTSAEKTLYLAGDTIWYDEIHTILDTYEPAVIITNNCAAEFAGYGRLIMDADDLYQVHQARPKAVIIASHMDTVAHAALTRDTLRQKLAEKGIADAVFIPADGELLSMH